MNKVDKVIYGLLARKGDHNPYEDKSNWSWFDYLMGYGMPLMMFCCVCVMLYYGLFA
jgi:hypothetical protein